MNEIIRIPYDTMKAFFKDDCINLAANISFYALFSIIPIGMITVSVAGYFIGSSENAHAEIFKFISEVLPVGKDIISANIQSVMEKKSSLGIVGLIFLLLFSTLIVSSLESALDKIFQTENRRNFLHSRLLGIVLAFSIAILFSLPTIAQITESTLARFGFNFPLFDLMNTRVFFFILAYATFIIAVVVIPNHKILIRHAAIGGLIFAPGIAIARFIFQSFMTVAVSKYNIIYGSLTAAVLLIIWIYYLAVVMLISSELVCTLQKRNPFTNE